MKIMTHRMDEFLIDSLTGEIIGVYEDFEITPPRKADMDFYKCKFLFDIESKEELEEYISIYVDKRKLMLVDDTKYLHNLSCGDSSRSGTKNIFTLPKYTVMNKLVRCLNYANIIVGTRKGLADVLGVNTKHLERTISVVSDLVSYTKTNKSYLIIRIHPAFGFRYESNLFGIARDEYLKNWYSKVTTLAQQGVKSPDIKTSKEFDNWLTKFEKQVKSKDKQNIDDFGVEIEGVGVRDEFYDKELENKFLSEYSSNGKV